jgi:two-component system CheB/CheR fusion protein
MAHDERPESTDVPQTAAQEPPAAPAHTPEIEGLGAPAASSATQGPDIPAFPIVGVGASAGGLEAFTHLLQALSADIGMAFVLVQHLSPEHESLLADLLARETRLPVITAEDGMTVTPNRVYVIPPNTYLLITQGVLHLVPRGEIPGPFIPIDHFFYAPWRRISSATPSP